MELYYNPERMSEQEIKETFVAHQWLVDEIISILKGQPTGAGVQHIVIVAPRGMGKTTILLMLRYAVLGGEIASQWQPVLFPEESYGVYDLADLWLEVINHIAAETGDAPLHDQVVALRDEQSHGSDLQEAALAKIKDWRVKNKKRLMLLVDNFDMILAQIGDERDNARLRDVLMNDDALMLIGGSTTFFKEARAYDQPLYNLFKIYNLNALDSAQIQELLRRRARIDNFPNFEELLQANKTRLRVLEYFTGGNPRLVLMLYRVITHSDLSEVKRGLEKLLDEVTPYYKAKVESLPAQQRKILDHIARISSQTREGLTPTEIASATRLAVNHVSAQLKRLAEVGYVRSANIRGRSSYYTLSEPLYAIWHQMRFGRDARRRMNWLVVFLKGWYDVQEIGSECQRLEAAFRQYMVDGLLTEARDALEYQRYLADAIDDRSMRASTVERIITGYLELRDTDTLKREVLSDIELQYLTKDTLVSLFTAGLISKSQSEIGTVEQLPNEARRAEAVAAVKLAHAAIRERRIEEALSQVNRALELDPTSFAALILQASVFAHLGRDAEGAVALNRALEGRERNDWIAWAVRGITLFAKGDFVESISDMDKALEMEPNIAFGWSLRADALRRLNRSDEALVSLDRALKVDPDDFDALFQKVMVLLGQKRKKRAIVGIERMLELKPKSADALFLRGMARAMEPGTEALEDVKLSFRVGSGPRQELMNIPGALHLRFHIEVADGRLDDAKRTWRTLAKPPTDKDQSAWSEQMSQILRQAAQLGQWSFVRELIDSSDLEEPLFPLVRALDYLLEGDEALIEKLSPEVRAIVDEIVSTLRQSAQNKNSTGKRQLAAKSQSKAKRENGKKQSPRTRRSLSN